MSAGSGMERNGVVTLRDRWHAAARFDDMLGTVQKNVDLWAAVSRRARVPENYVARVEKLGRQWHLLALSEDWCGDAVNTLPVVAKLAELSPLVDMRVLARDQNEDLMAAHLTGESRSIPVVMALNEEFTERGWWGPRPAELQRWVLGPGQELDKTTRYRDVLAWYARDRGSAVLDELLAIMEHAAI